MTKFLFRLQSYAALQYVVTVLLLTSCVDTKVPDEYNRLDFNGIESMELDEFGNLVLKWVALTSPTDDLVSYHVYMRKVADVDALGIDELDDFQPLAVDLPPEQQPKTSGELLKIISSDNYKVDQALDDNVVYAFQVVAKAGNRVGDNPKVYSIRYFKRVTDASDIALEIVAGSFQLGTAGENFPAPLKVKLSKAGTPLPAKIITYEILTGGGTLTPASAVTDTNGEASVNFIAGPDAGSVEIMAHWQSLREAKFILLSQKGEASSLPKLEIVSGNLQTGTTSTQFSRTLKVKASEGNTALVDKSINFSLTSGAGAYLSHAVKNTDNDGTASILFTAGSAAGSYTVRAEMDDGTSVEFQLLAELPSASATLNIVSGNFQLGLVSQAFADALKVRLTSSGLPLAGEPIAFTIIKGAGASLSQSSVQTDSLGEASVSLTAGATVTSLEVKAVWGTSQESVTFVLIANHPTDPFSSVKIETFSGNYQTGNVSTAFALPLTARLTNGSLAKAGEPVTFAIASGSGASLSSLSATTDADGKAGVTFTAGALKGTYVVSASWATGGGDSRTTSFVLTAADPNDAVSLGIGSGNLQTGYINQTLAAPLLVRLLQNSASYVGQTINFSVTAGTGATLSAASAVTNSSGEAQVSFTPGSATGAYQVTASWNNGLRSVSFQLYAEDPISGVSLTVEAGNFQVAAPSTAFASPLKARLADDGVAVAGETIGFAITFAPAGAVNQTLSAATATTNASGDAVVTFSGGDLDGTYEVTATWGVKVTKFALIVDASKGNKIIKIVQNGVGAQPEITTETLDIVADTLPVKASLYDVAGTTYLGDVSVAWSLTGGGFNSADLSGTPAGAISIVFDPTRTGTTSLTATYMGADTTIVGTSDSTGFLTVNSTLVPEVISIIAGDNQSVIVDNTLATALKVRVTNASGVPVPGQGVNFTSTQGGGAAITGQPALTDADGYASASVKVGTSAMINIFRATIVSTPSLTADFSATANVGAASKLMFSTQPGGAAQYSVFTQQPVVTVTDTYGNLVTTANNSITLTVSAGTGTLSGTLTKVAVNGVAAFTNLVYNVQENAVAIRATPTPALTVAVSTAFNIAAPWPGACILSNTNWITADGGCKNVGSGLVVSASSVLVGGGTMTWADAVWNKDVFGSSLVETSDKDRTNDIDLANGCSGSCDSTGTSYCHDLVQGGKDDWRLPTRSELDSIATGGAATHLPGDLNTNFWTSTELPGAPVHAQLVNLSNGVSTYQPKTNLRAVVCVRGSTRGTLSGGSVIAHQVPDTSCLVSGMTNNGGAYCDLKVRIKDSLGMNLNASGHTITLTPSAGSLTSGATAVTDVNGIATFSSLNFSTNGVIDVTAASIGLTSSVIPVTVKIAGSFKGCRTGISGWSTAGGGCRNDTTGLVYSFLSNGSMLWTDAIGDIDLDGVFADTDHDYENDPGSGIDTSSTHYCMNLVEGGHSDWRMPKASELGNASFANATDRPLLFDISWNFWTSKTHTTTTAACIFLGLNGSAVQCSSSSPNLKTLAMQRVVCVRGP